VLEPFSNFSFDLYQITAQVTDLRSSVCKEGCKTVAVLSFCLRQHFIPLAEFFVPSLLKQVILKIQVMSSTADKSIRVVVACLTLNSNSPNADSKLLSLLVEACSNKSAILRKMSVEYLALHCALAKQDSIEK